MLRKRKVTLRESMQAAITQERQPENWRVKESSSTRTTIYDYLSIGSLSKVKTEELLTLYFDSYHRSIWSTVMQEDKHTLDIEETNKLQGWYTCEDGRSWFKNALKFYMDQTKAGHCRLVIVEEKKSGKMIAGFFILTASAFLENTEKSHAAELLRIMRKVGASATHTFYGGELFASPDIRGFRGGAMLLRVIEQTLDYAIENGFTHIISWTLDRKDNLLSNISKKIGFSPVPGGCFEKGTDLGLMENGKLGFTTSKFGPVTYLYADTASFLKAIA